MAHRSVFLMIAFSLVASCAAPRSRFDRLGDKAIWEATNAGGTIEDLVCRGLSRKKAHLLLKTYFEKENRLRKVLGWQSWAGQEVVAMHFGCAFYRGSARTYMRHIDELDRRILQQRR